MPWTFYNANGQRLSSAATNISVLDIDGATDIGAAIVDADLFIIDDGAGGTNRKTAASRIKTYVGPGPTTTLTWVYSGTAPTIVVDTNVASLDEDGTGIIGVNFTTSYATTTYQALVTMARDGSSLSEGITDRVAASLVIRLKEGSTATNGDGHLVCFGALA